MEPTNMKAYVTYAVGGRSAQELHLIEELCKFEGIQYLPCYPEAKNENGENYFKKYYKGHSPAIILDDGAVVLYGFWKFAEYLLKNGMLRC
jgi:hypothetical protein